MQRVCITVGRKSLYYCWSKELLEAGKKRLSGDITHQAISNEVKTLRAEARDLKEALEAAVSSNRPSLLDVHVDAEVRPPATGTWQLPPTPYGEPTFGDLYLPD